MYVYYVLLSTGRGGCFVHRKEVITDQSGSECVWIVPGTMGVDD